MRLQIKKPYTELGCIISALNPFLINFYRRYEDKLILKVFVDNEKKNTKDIELLYYLLHPFIKEYSKGDVSKTDLYRVVITKEEVEFFYSTERGYSSFYFTIEDAKNDFEDINSMSDKELENLYLDQIIDLLTQKK